MARTLKGKLDADTLSAKLERHMEHSALSCRCTHKTKKRAGGIEIILMVFERFSARSAKSITLTVLIIDDQRTTTCELVASGGNLISALAGGDSEKDFEKEAAEFLKEMDFD